MEKDHPCQYPQIPVKSAPLPAMIDDGTHRVSVNKNEAGTLFVRVAQGEQTVFTAALSDRQDVSLVFADGRQVLFPHPEKRNEESTGENGGDTKEIPVEVKQEILAHPITIEGYPVRAGKYTLDETSGDRQYRLILAHHPNPKDRKQVVYYDLTAEGDKADECFKAGITDTRTPVHVTGDDLTRVTTKKDGTEKLIHEISVDTLEKIRERRPDNPEILREKVPLNQSH